MTRTTIDIDPAVLRALKLRAQQDQRSMGELASELLAQALRTEPAAERRIEWNSQPMGARVDINDIDALFRDLDDR